MKFTKTLFWCNFPPDFVTSRVTLHFDDTLVGVQAMKRNRLTLDERRGQDLLSFDDLRLFGIRYSRAHLYRLIKAGSFPQPVRLGEARVAFVRDEIVAWIEGLGRGLTNRGRAA
jgi:prophage regulatory protein